MSATAKAPLVRAGPGVSAWTALPERDRALLLWLVQGDVVTAELAALLAYGHLRVAQRRLARLVEYGLLHVGIVVGSQRRAHAVRRTLRPSAEEMAGAIRVWVTTEAELMTDPHGAVWISPAVDAIRTLDLDPHPFDEPWPILGPLCLATPDVLEVLGERAIAAVPALR